MLADVTLFGSCGRDVATRVTFPNYFWSKDAVTGALLDSGFDRVEWLVPLVAADAPGDVANEFGRINRTPALDAVGFFYQYLICGCIVITNHFIVHFDDWLDVTVLQRPSPSFRGRTAAPWSLRSILEVQRVADRDGPPGMDSTRDGAGGNDKSPERGAFGKRWESFGGGGADFCAFGYTETE
ncbi:hypothetical protein THAOC_24561 [Thalassiosira oceanica]|uniref:Uncharacterized protein n=1 Tax=Thalassiosira oceanica TaxID=159749 RepID=K0RPI9_THAOC|nr:hypothetical protein THAOC_24561 [Thalassiosira oceanica]|eukprot:EJK55678.1 hypothetical protein THAOC_24561 [Thalassiosira oceanica]